MFWQGNKFYEFAKHYIFIEKKIDSGIIFITLIFYNVFKISYIQLCYEN